MFRYLIGLGVGAALLAAVAVALTGIQPRTHTHTFQDITAQITVSPAGVAWPGHPLTIEWQIDNAAEVYVNESGRIGTDSDTLVIDQCHTPWTLRLVTRDGAEDVITLQPGVWLLDAANALFLLLALIPALLFFSSPEGITAINRWRAGVLMSTVVLAWYAFVPFCEGAALWSYMAVYPVNTLLYLGAIVWGVAALLISLIRPAFIEQMRGFLQRMPQPALFAVVLGLVWMWGLLLAMWGYRLPFLTVLPPALVLASWIIIALYTNHQVQADNNFLPTIPRHWVFAGILLLGGVLWLVPWQSLISNLWLRTGLGLLAFILPGALIVQLAYRNQPWRLSRSLGLGFVISVGITGLMGWFGTMLSLPPAFVSGALALLGVVALAALYRYPTQQTPPTPARVDSGERFSLLLLALIGVVIAVIVSRGTLSFMTYYGNNLDYLTYNAQVTYFAQTPTLSLTDPFLGTDFQVLERFWLSFFPLSQATISNLAGVHPLILQGTLGVWIGLLAFVTVYSLARAFSFSRLMAWFAVIAQAAALTLLLQNDEPGFIFMERILQDKALLAFVIAPVMVEMLLGLREQAQWPRLGVFILGGLSMTFTHPTLLFMTAVILGLMALQDMVFNRRFAVNLMAVLVLGLCMLPPVGIRVTADFVDDAYNAEEPDELPDRHVRRLTFIEGSPFIGLQSHLVDGVPFLLFFAGMGVALFHIRKRTEAHYILSAGLLIVLVVLPYTGWLVAYAITVTQIWRVPWLAPFGLSAVFLLSVLISRWSLEGRRALMIPMLGTLLLAVAILSLGGAQWMERDLQRLQSGGSSLNTYDALLDIAAYIEGEYEGTALILGDVHTSSLIPALSNQLATVAFRGELMFRQVSGLRLTMPDRYDDYLDFFQVDDNDLRLQILQRYDVDYVLIRDGNLATDSLAAAYPDQFQQVYQSGRYRLYQVIR